MQLLTKEIIKKLPALRETEGQGKEAVAHVKFFTPDSNWTWYGVEYDAEQRMFFGLVDGFEKEIGYFGLDELEEIKMCVAYDIDGKRIDYLPTAADEQLKIKPIYKIFPGWKSSTQGIKNVEALPEKAKDYIYALEDFIGTKISSISTSPERKDTILIENPFDI